MKTIYKANGKTFHSMDKVVKYATENRYVITGTETIKYKNIDMIVLVNLKEESK